MILAAFLLCQAVPLEGQWSEPKSGKLEYQQLKLEAAGPYGPGKQTYSLSKLPPHQALKLEFILHLTGGWDGVGPWGPDRWLCGLEGGQRFLDTSFNNCFQIWSDNVNQSFPESFFPLQQEDCTPLPPKGLTACFGGTGATAFGRLGPKIEGKPTDSSYKLSFVLPHSAASAQFYFHSLCTDPIEDEQWWIGELKVTPLDKLPEAAPAEIAAHWSVLFSGDALASYASRQFFISHPEALLQRAEGFVVGKAELGRALLAAASAPVPPDGLRRVVETDDAGRRSLAAWRELSLLACRDEVTAAALATETDPGRRLWLRALRSQIALTPPRELALLRLHALLRENGSPAAIALADKVKDIQLKAKRSVDSDD